MRITESPGFKYFMRETKSLITKYKARRPKMAMIFELKAINPSWVTEKTAGIESTAKIISLASTITKATINGVACHTPLILVKYYK
jgi:hypothetical protein